MIDYIKEFPIPEECLPKLLKDLLSPESIDNPSKEVCVTSRYKNNNFKEGYEYLDMIMACVPEDLTSSIEHLRENCDGLVSRDVYSCDEKGGIKSFSPSISGYDYIVASWGNVSYCSYSLAEKVCMALMLTPRAIGNLEQKIIYDDLSKPVIAVAGGDIVAENNFEIHPCINWFMRNDYLRKYLWMRACSGVRVFNYEAYIDDCAAVREVMSGKIFFHQIIDGKWGELYIIEREGRLLLQVWASVIAVSPELCKEQDIDALLWPNDTQIMTMERAKALNPHLRIFLDDKFLEKYEKNSIFNSVPYKYYDHFYNTVSYRGQWSFYSDGCRRHGRNVLEISSYDLYRGIVPVQEIYHAYQHALPINEDDINTSEEHIVSKTDRLLQQLIDLGKNLSSLLKAINGNIILPINFIEFTREKYETEGFKAFPIIQKMTQVAPLDMYKQDFLARCKTLNEIIVKLKTGSLRKIMYATGADKKHVNELETLKLLQGILNIIDHLNEQYEGSNILANSASYVDWKARNDKLAPLFINNDLRNADAHVKIGETLYRLEELGFDTASINEGYGRALDFLLDSVIDSLEAINTRITELLKR